MLRPIPAVTALALLAIPPVIAQPGFTTYLIAFTMEAGAPALGSALQELRKSHAAHVDTLWKEGLLVASGPIEDKSAFRDVLIFTGDRRELVEKRMDDAPLVKAGVLQVALGPWVAPLGIGDEYRKRAAGGPGVADQLRTYQLVMLKSVLGTRLAQEEQRGLLLHMDAMAKVGQLAIAGPVLEGSDLAWIFVFTTGADETDALMAANPAVKGGKMTAERHPWRVADGVLPPGFKVPLAARHDIAHARAGRVARD